MESVSLSDRVVTADHVEGLLAALLQRSPGHLSVNCVCQTDLPRKLPNNEVIYHRKVFLSQNGPSEVSASYLAGLRTTVTLASVPVEEWLVSKKTGARAAWTSSKACALKGNVEALLKGLNARFVLDPIKPPLLRGFHVDVHHPLLPVCVAVSDVGSDDMLLVTLSCSSASMPIDDATKILREVEATLAPWLAEA
jgi:hypothetical protein